MVWRGGRHRPHHKVQRQSEKESCHNTEDDRHALFSPSVRLTAFFLPFSPAKVVVGFGCDRGHSVLLGSTATSTVTKFGADDGPLRETRAVPHLRQASIVPHSLSGRVRSACLRSETKSQSHPRRHSSFRQMQSRAPGLYRGP